MSPLRKTSNSTRIDLRIPDILLEKIRELAIENNAPVHHRSHKPELTSTIIDLLEKALSGNTSDSLSDTYHDINIKQELETIKSDIESLKSAIFQPNNTLESLPDTYHDIEKTTDDAIAPKITSITSGILKPKDDRRYSHAELAVILSIKASTVRGAATDCRKRNKPYHGYFPGDNADWFEVTD